MEVDMILFVLGVVFFSLAATAFSVALALWTYADAKVKSDQSPVLWVLLVLLVNPIGIILYLLMGRTNRQAEPPGTFKSLMIAMAVLAILSALIFAVGTVRFVRSESTGVGSVRSGSFTMVRSNVRNNEWTFTARNANGSERRSPNLNAAQLAAFHVLSDSGDGIMLRLTQENRTELVDISGFFDGYIDMSAFEPGRVRVTLEFNHANDVDVKVSWRG